jgi:hypothetical protein
MSAARLKHFGWGREGEGLTAEEEAFVVARDHMCRITNTIQTTMSAIISREKRRGSSPQGVKRSPPSVGRAGDCAAGMRVGG